MSNPIFFTYQHPTGPEENPFKYNDGTIPQVLLGSYYNSLIFDVKRRTIWHEGWPFGHSYWGSSYGEIFNDFDNNKAIGYYSHAEGLNTFTNGTGVHAEGIFTKGLGYASHVEGNYNQSQSSYTHSEGSYTIASGEGSHSEGTYTYAKGKSSHAEGYLSYVLSTGHYSHVEGRETKSEGEASHAEGCLTNTKGGYSHAEGYSTETTGEASHAEGIETESCAQASHSEGYKTNANSNYSHAEGYSTETTGEASHAEGYSTHANGKYSHSEGEGTSAKGEASHAEGSLTEAEGDYSHSEGYLAHAIGEYSHAEGNNTYAEGVTSHAEGYNTYAIGNYSHSEGYNTYANGHYSHAGGNHNYANADYSIVNGNNVKTVGEYSAINGKDIDITSKNARFSFVHGEGLHVSRYGEVAFGKFNAHDHNNKSIEDTNEYHLRTVFTIGDGTSETERSNIFEVTQEGTSYSGGRQLIDTIKLDGTNTHIWKGTHESFKNIDTYPPDTIFFVEDYDLEIDANEEIVTIKQYHDLLNELNSLKLMLNNVVWRSSAGGSLSPVSYLWAGNHKDYNEIISQGISYNDTAFLCKRNYNDGDEDGYDETKKIPIMVEMNHDYIDYITINGLICYDNQTIYVNYGALVNWEAKVKNGYTAISDEITIDIMVNEHIDSIIVDTTLSDEDEQDYSKGSFIAISETGHIISPVCEPN